MVSIGELGLAGTRRQASDVVPQTNMLQVAGGALGVIGEAKQVQERNEIIMQQQQASELEKQQRLQEREASGYLVEKVSNLQLSGQAALENARINATDPNKITETFFENYQGAYNEALKDAPNDIARQKLNQEFLKMRATFGKRAIETQVQEVQNKRNTALEQSINGLTNYARQGSYADAKIVSNSIIENAANFKSAAELEALKIDIANKLEVARLDGLFEKNQLSEVRTLINQPDSVLSAKQQESYRDAIRKQEDKLTKMSTQDPVGYLMATNQPSDIESAVAMQEKQGINKYNARVMSDIDAQDLSKQITNITTPASMTQFMIKLKQDYGAYTPNAVSDLIKQKIPSQFGFMLQMANEDPVGYSKPIELMFKVINAKPSEFKDDFSQQALLKSTTESDFKLKVLQEIEDDLDIMKEEINNRSVLINPTIDLAKAHFIENGDVDGAVSFAAETLRKGYEIGDYNGSKYRINPEYNRDNIEGGLKFATENIDIIAQNYDPYIAGLVGNQLKEDAVFTTNADFTGLNLKTVGGDLLRDKSGKVVNLQFKDLDKIYRKNEKQIKDRRKKLETDIIMEQQQWMDFTGR